MLSSSEFIRATLSLLLMWMEFHCIGGQIQRDLRCVIREESPVGSQVIDLQTAFDPNDGSGENFRFRFLSQPPCDIELEETTGRVTTRGRIDREVICREDDLCRFRLDVAVTRTSYFAMVRLTIEVEDVNDNAPEFQPPVLRQEMVESSALGTAVVLPAAKDSDSSRNSVVRYEMTPDDQEGHFELNVRRKLDGTMDIRLRLVKQLDRETRDSHRMKVAAFDGGSPTLSGSIVVEIVVTDANDNAPVFQFDSYEVSVVESVPESTPVATVRATDLDLGKNGKVVHSFSPQTLIDYGHVFRIDPSTGEIQVAGVVDHEAHQVYRLTVNAEDQGQNVLTAETTIVISVQDVNDNPPVIVINTLAAFNTNESSVTEGVEPGSFVAQIRVQDADSGLNGQFSCSLDHNDQFTLQLTADGEYMIVTRSTLDRERRDFYVVRIQCMDGGKPALMSSRQLGIKVLDSNDHYPRFSREKYEEEVLENNYIGTTVVRVTATDDDEGDNALISYELPVELSQYFEVDSGDGTIQAKLSLDRESVPVYRFFVYAKDHGLPVRTGSALVVLRVVDVNDETPVFRFNSRSPLTVRENLPAGTEVGVLSATDNDNFPLNLFTFSFLPGGSLSDAFSVDSKTGRITTTRTLDREEKELYHLVAVVRDDGSPTLSSTATVSVIVADENDNDPTFVESSSSIEHSNDGNQKNVTVVIIIVPRRTSVGATVAEVKAIDPDAGANGAVVYSVSGAESCSSAFEIDPSSGRLTLATDLLECRENVTLELNVTATDRGTPARQSSTRLRIMVDDTILAAPPTLPPHQTGLFLGLTFNFVVVLILSVAVGSGMILSIIVVGVFLRNRSRRQQGSQKYNCRMETIKAINLSNPNYVTPSKVKSSPDIHFYPIQLEEERGSSTEKMSAKGSKDSLSSFDRYSELPSSAEGVWKNQNGRDRGGVGRKNDSVAVLLQSESPSSGSTQIVSTRTYETIPFNHHHHHQYRSSSPFRSRDNTSSPVLNRKLANRPQPSSLTSLASDLESKSQWRMEPNTSVASPAAAMGPGPTHDGIKTGGACTVKLPPQVRMADMADGRIHHSDNGIPPNYHHLDDERVQMLLSSQRMMSPCSHLRSSNGIGSECSSFRPDTPKEEDGSYSIRERYISNNVH